MRETRRRTVSYGIGAAAVQRGGQILLAEEHTFEFDVEIPALGDAELVQQTGREGELLVGAVAQIVRAVREIHGHVTEADERNGVVGAVCTVAARPVREVDHQVGVHEHIGRALRIAA